MAHLDSSQSRCSIILASISIIVSWDWQTPATTFDGGTPAAVRPVSTRYNSSSSVSDTASSRIHLYVDVLVVHKMKPSGWSA